MENRTAKKNEVDEKKILKDIVARFSVSPTEKKFLKTLVESSLCTTSEVLRRAVFGIAIPTSLESALSGQLMKRIGLVKNLHNKSQGLYGSQTKIIWEQCLNAQVALRKNVACEDNDNEEHHDLLFDESEQRIESVGVRFSEAEYFDIKKKCLLEGISISHFFRASFKKRQIKKSRVTISMFNEFIDLGRELREAMDLQGVSIASVRSEKIIQALESHVRYLQNMTF